MSSPRAFMVLAIATIDLASLWQLGRSRTETSFERVRALGRRARALAALALFFTFLGPVVALILAFKATKSVDVGGRAAALAAGIADAMNDAVLGQVLFLPALFIALHLLGRARAMQRSRAMQR